jgi:excisionase family DNA binding protein
MDVLESDHAGYVTTRTAARMLGLSTTMVQLMLDKQEIEGWKTPGGHRRVSTRSLLEFKKRKNIPVLDHSRPVRVPLVMVVCENEAVREQLQQAGAIGRLPFEFRWPRSLEGAMTELLRAQPSQFVAELRRPREVVSSVLGTLDALQGLGLQTVITVLTDTAQEDLPTDSDIQMAPGPLTAELLQVSLAGLQASELSRKKKEGATRKPVS